MLILVNILQGKGTNYEHRIPPIHHMHASSDYNYGSSNSICN
ncbi:unnamed protein product, partial [marine sediment metagenome]